MYILIYILIQSIYDFAIECKLFKLRFLSLQSHDGSLLSVTHEMEQLYEAHHYDLDFVNGTT